MTDVDTGWAPNEASRYVTDELYRSLMAQEERSRVLGLATDSAITLESASVLYFEARLLDEGRYDEWAELFTRECIYWVPIRAVGSDPRSEWCLVFDDRRRLMDRVSWLNDGWVHAQVPKPRTARLITNVEVFPGDDGTRLVRSNFSIHEHRRGHGRTWVGAYEHLLTHDTGQWLIHRKRVTLVDSAEAHENLTIIL